MNITSFKAVIKGVVFVIAGAGAMAVSATSQSSSQGNDEFKQMTYADLVSTLPGSRAIFHYPSREKDRPMAVFSQAEPLENYPVSGKMYYGFNRQIPQDFGHWVIMEKSSSAYVCLFAVEIRRKYFPPECFLAAAKQSKPDAVYLVSEERFNLADIKATHIFHSIARGDKYGIESQYKKNVRIMAIDQQKKKTLKGLVEAFSASAGASSGGRRQCANGYEIPDGKGGCRYAPARGLQ